MSKVKKLFYEGKLTKSFSEGGEGEDLIKEAELFSTGIHRGTEYTVEDLNTLANNFDVTEEIPIQLDHSNSVRDTVGYLEEVSVEGDKLLGKVRIIDDSTKERIEKGLMKKLSISFYIQYNEEDDTIRPHKLREVSLVAFPQVKSARLFSENGYSSEIDENKGVEPMPGQNNQQPQNFAQLQEQYKQLEEQMKQLQAQNQSFSEGKINSKIEKFQEESKIVPAQAASLKNLLSSFSEEQTQMFDEFMKNATQIDFQEQGEVAREGDPDKRTQEQKEFDKFYEEHEAKFGSSL
ncbi:DUF2213 domain-containing protein [Bacillus thuringiensis]|uniref:DUF2213 domain-containing protein n=1 Tax=Bacillus thuringiensis TaxID=1428 RepID=UPI001FAC1556|nr:DUF2213 domain-containing protein [Bacillus thuringiensis]MDM8365834.1 DUF2213 domain-containing protein [Bacillus thuringiensis]HDT6579210.1 DUF2213 domain-containing protein [Bacillus cereus]